VVFHVLFLLSLVSYLHNPIILFQTQDYFNFLNFQIEIEGIGCDRDHIHLLCSGHPKISPWQIVRIFKSITAREIFRRKPEVKKELWGGEFWTDGYYVGTVGERGNWEVVKEYVRKQGRSEKDLRQLDLFKNS